MEGVVGSGSRERARKTRAGVSFPRRKAGTRWLWGGGLGCYGVVFRWGRYEVWAVGRKQLAVDDC